MEIAQHRAVWRFIQTCLAQGSPVALLYVVESNGSSPGRKGFIMAASRNACTSTIGGGMMEYKLVELSRAMIGQGETTIRLVTQYHDKEHASDQSGMICSGMQRIVIVPVIQTQQEFVECCRQVSEVRGRGQVEITPIGVRFHHHPDQADGFFYESESTWQFRETIGIQPKVHLIGAGHVSLALSELMSRLGFYVIVYDDRPELNTLLENQFSNEKHIIQYHSIGEIFDGATEDYVVIMTIGYRSDDIVLRQLIHNPFRYIGMLGSKAKIASLFQELCNEGFTPTQLSHIHAPVGLSIGSQTSYEIAVSIAAEIIQEKNKTMHHVRLDY